MHKFLSLIIFAFLTFTIAVYLFDKHDKPAYPYYCKVLPEIHHAGIRYTLWADNQIPKLILLYNYQMPLQGIILYYNAFSTPKRTKVFLRFTFGVMSMWSSFHTVGWHSSSCYIMS